MEHQYGTHQTRYLKTLKKSIIREGSHLSTHFRTEGYPAQRSQNHPETINRIIRSEIQAREKIIISSSPTFRTILLL